MPCLPLVPSNRPPRRVQSPPAPVAPPRTREDHLRLVAIGAPSALLVLVLSVVALRFSDPASEWFVFCAVPLLGWGLGGVFFIVRHLLAAWDAPR